MKGKLLILTGAAAGYVLGTHAGRERYEQIRGRVSSLWHDPSVQEKVTQAQQTVEEKAPEIQHKVSDAASQAAERAKSAVRRDEDDNASDDDEEVGGNDRMG